MCFAKRSVIRDSLKKNGFKVTKRNVLNTEINELDKDYDLMLFGCSTWSFGEDEFEMQSGFKPFYNEIGQYQFINKKIGVFGCGDSSYKYFCSAVDQIEELISSKNGSLAGSSLKVDGDPFRNSTDINKWVSTLVKSV
ncbi:MAG: flavodoxin [Deltaproteobacteria bacterium]|nr:flavodoxin [Deltaproteobacteria bacterium]